MSIDVLIKNAENDEKYKECLRIKDQISSNPFFFVGAGICILSAKIVDIVDGRIPFLIGVFLFFASSIGLAFYHFTYGLPKKLLKKASLTEDGLYNILSFRNKMLTEKERKELMRAYNGIKAPELKSFIDNSPKETLADFIKMDNDLKGLSDIQTALRLTRENHVKTGHLVIYDDDGSIKVTKEDLNAMRLSDHYKIFAEDLIARGVKKITIKKMYASLYKNDR